MKYWTRIGDFWVMGDPSGEMGVYIVKDLGYWVLVLGFLVNGKLFTSYLEWIGGSPVQDIHYEEEALIERDGEWELKYSAYFHSHTPSPEEKDFMKEIKRIGERILIEKKQLIEEKLRKAEEIVKDLPELRPSCQGFPEVIEI